MITLLEEQFDENIKEVIYIYVYVCIYFLHYNDNLHTEKVGTNVGK